MSVIYGHPTDAAAFEQYYAETHMPLVAKMQGLRRFEASKVVGTPVAASPLTTGWPISISTGPTT